MKRQRSMRRPPCLDESSKQGGRLFYHGKMLSIRTMDETTGFLFGFTVLHIEFGGLDNFFAFLQDFDPATCGRMGEE